MNETQEGLGPSPELFPHALEAREDRVVFVRLGRADYEKASFLDARILTQGAVSASLPWPKVAAAIEAARLTESCRYIFHIGHVGSTLLSRLIGAHRGAFALREPSILRTFAQLRDLPETQPPAWRAGDLESRFCGCLKLLSRTFEAEQSAVVKATSFVSEIAAEILSRAAAPKALLMYVAPETYIATILGGPNSRREAALLTPGRLQRLHRRIGAEPWQAPSLSEGETVALGWACETSALARAAATAGNRALPVDFDRFLDDPFLLQSYLRHLGFDADSGEVRAILQGPEMHRYSKAPEYSYDAALRRDVLNEARAAHGGEIRRGLAWLERAAAQYPAVRQALALAARPNL